VDINPSAHTLTSLYPGAAVVDARDRIVVPGFVNAHHHGESVLLRYITLRASYAAWNALPGLGGAFARLLDPASASDVASLYRIAGFLHLRSGTTTVADYPASYAPAVLQGAIEQVASAGVRSVFALQTWDQIESFRSSPSALRQFSIALGPEDGYTVYSFENLVRASTETQFPLAAHLGETRAEVEALRGRFKKSPLRILKDCGALIPSTHLMHCNHIPERDLDLIRDGGNPVTLCVRSTLAKGTGYPLLRALASRDVTICLGTDWGETDLLGEIRVLRNLRRYFPGVPRYTPLELMRMATINGAHALGIASHTGSLEVGKHADLVMIPCDDVRLPALRANPTAEEVAGVITDYCDTGMIADVMAQGVFRVRNGAAVRVDAGELLREFRRLQGAFIPPAAEESEPDRSLGVSLVPSEGSDKNGLLGPGGAEEEVPREKNANLRPPGPVPEEMPQKFPVITKKIKKVFGEDDI
jgi:cytosine/adenosine deaminase-related metal-dependent hydrolase